MKKLLQTSNRWFLKTSVICLFLFSALTSAATTYTVSTITAFNSAVSSAAPGDKIVMASGRWYNVKLVANKSGTSVNRITIEAQVSGETIICGKSSMQISGNYVTVSGLVFTEGEPTLDDVVQFKDDAGNVANYSTLDNCVFLNISFQDKTKTDHYVNLFGKRNNVQYCYFEGKTDYGCVISLEIPDSRSTENYHHIHHNYFGRRAPYNANGGEQIRVGRWEVQDSSSRTLIENNYFEYCDGENEIVSVKSSDNIVRNNVFFECAGQVSLRHGERNHVYGNYFIGNNKPLTAGVKISDKGHLVFNNLFYRLAGNKYDQETYSAITLIAGEFNPNGSGHARVQDLEIANNTFVECAYPFNLGKLAPGRDSLPNGVKVLNNMLNCPANSSWYIKDAGVSNLQITNNLVKLSSGTTFNSLASSASISSLTCNAGYSFSFASVVSTLPSYVDYDINASARSSGYVGALENTANRCNIDLPSKDNTGPEWYREYAQPAVWNSDYSTWVYDFSTRTGNGDTVFSGSGLESISATSTTGFLPKPPSGKARVATSTGQAIFTLLDSRKLDKLRFQASNSAAPGKVSMYDAETGSSITRIAFKVNFEKITDNYADWTFALGSTNNSSSVFNNSSSVSTSTTSTSSNPELFGVLKWVVSSSDANKMQCSYRVKASASATIDMINFAPNYFLRGYDYNMEILCNNSDATQSYTKGGVTCYIPSKTYQIWANNMRIERAAGLFSFPANELPVNSELNAFMVIGNNSRVASNPSSTNNDGAVRIGAINMQFVNAGQAMSSSFNSTNNSISPKSKQDTLTNSTLIAYPNPFTTNTIATFTLKTDESNVSLDLYNSFGLKVSHLYSGPAFANQTQSFYLNNNNLRVGVYFLKLSGAKTNLTFSVIAK